MGGFPESDTLHHGMASWDVAGTYSFIVPAGVTRLLIDLVGGAGAGCGRCLHWVDVSPGASLAITIGQNNTDPTGNSTCTGPGFVLTAAFGGGEVVPPGDSSGGNVLSPLGGIGYCVIQW